MENKKSKIWSLWVPLGISVAVGLVYLIIYLVDGFIPTVDKIALLKEENGTIWGINRAINLPFAISRIWDVPLAFVYLFLLSSLIKYKEKDESGEEYYTGAIMGFAMLVWCPVSIFLISLIIYWIFDYEIAFIFYLILVSTLGLLTSWEKIITSWKRIINRKKWKLSLLICSEIGLILGIAWFKTSGLIVSFLISFGLCFILTVISVLSLCFIYIYNKKIKGCRI